MKPWCKGTTEGRLYVDTKHPEYKKWFLEQVKKYSKLDILKSNQHPDNKLPNNSADNKGNNEVPPS